MEHRDVEQFLQPLFDDEAVRSLDVFQVDAAEGRAEIAHAVDEGVDIGGVDEKIGGIDIGKALEQRALAFHDRLGGQSTEIAKSQDRRAVRDDRNQVALVGVVVGQRRVFSDGFHRNRDTGRIGQRQVALRGERLRRGDFEFARLTLRVELQCLLRGDASRRVFVSHPSASSLRCRLPKGGRGKASVGSGPPAGRGRTVGSCGKFLNAARLLLSVYEPEWRPSPP